MEETAERTQAWSGDHSPLCAQAVLSLQGTVRPPAAGTAFRPESETVGACAWGPRGLQGQGRTGRPVMAKGPVGPAFGSAQHRSEEAGR